MWRGGALCPPLPLTFSTLPSSYNLPKKTMNALQHSIFRKIHLPSSPKLFLRAAGNISNLFPIIADFIWVMNVVSKPSTTCWKQWEISEAYSGGTFPIRLQRHNCQGIFTRLFLCSDPSAPSPLEIPALQSSLPTLPVKIKQKLEKGKTVKGSDKVLGLSEFKPCGYIFFGFFFPTEEKLQ